MEETTVLASSVHRRTRQLLISIQESAPAPASGARSSSLSSSPAEEIAMILKDLEYMEFIWERIGAFLKDAEELEIEKESMKLWLRDLRDLADDADNVVGFYKYKMLCIDIEKHPLSDGYFRSEMATTMGSIREKSESIAKRRKALHPAMEEATVLASSIPCMTRQLLSSIEEGAPFFTKKKKERKMEEGAPARGGGWSSSSSAEEMAMILKDLVDVESMWKSVRAVLKDAEEMEISKESVKFWLHDLRELAYDAEDAIDVYNYEMHRIELLKSVISEMAQLLSAGRPFDKRHNSIAFFLSENYIRAEIVLGSIRGKFERIRIEKGLTHPYHPKLSQAIEESIDLIAETHRKLWPYFSKMVSLLTKFVQTRSKVQLSSLRISDVEKDTKEILKDIGNVLSMCYSQDWERLLENDEFCSWVSELKVLEGDFQYVLQHLKAGKNIIVHNSIAHPLSDGYFRAEMVSTLGSIREKFKRIAEQREALHLREGDGNGGSDTIVARQSTSSFSMDREIIGRSDDLEQLVKLLLSDDKDSSVADGIVPPVIAVVGIGGVGKTSLVQHVYNDPRVSQHFGSTKGWVCVSDRRFDLVKISREAAESLTEQPCGFSNIDSIQKKILGGIQGKKFLLVLDDVWNESENDWDRFNIPLKYGAKGSKILITTRSQKVAEAMQVKQSYALSSLSPRDSESLFTFHAFDSCNRNNKTELVAIGKDIVRKCEGLPLSLKLLGRLLRDEINKEIWRKVLKSEIWEIGAGDRILASLKLSYVYLPTYLKPCFTYWALFRKGDTILKEKLVRLWMADGLVDDKTGRQLEDVGMEYIDGLLSRSLLEPHNEYTVKMHDRLHDLARYLRRVECRKVRDDEFFALSGKIRSLPVINSSPAGFQGLEFPLTITISQRDLISCASLRNVPFEAQTFKHLRQLTLASSEHKLLESVGNFKLLRYLTLTSTVKELPESVCTLFNLQTLDLRHWHSLEKLPESFGHLKHLRYLDIEGTEIQQLPASIDCIPNLRCSYSKYLRQQRK